MNKINVIKSGYVREMLKNGKRDGARGISEYRPISIDVGYLPQAEGSANARIGNTNVLAGVKIAVDEPMPDKPNEGNLIVSAELLPLASAEYETGPPSPESIEFARVVDRGIRAAGVVDTGALFIEEGKVWAVFVDLYVLNYDGNLFDTGTLAASAALANTRMPRYEDGKVVRDGSMPKLKTGNTVTSCTYAKIDNRILLDPSRAEELVAETRMTIANDGTYVRAMQKGMSGAFKYKEIESMIELTFDKSKELRRLLETHKK